MSVKLISFGDYASVQWCRRIRRRNNVRSVEERRRSHFFKRAICALFETLYLALEDVV
jgi:hypothetical protein